MPVTPLVKRRSGLTTGSDVTIASDYLDRSDGWSGEVGTAGVHSMGTEQLDGKHHLPARDRHPHEPDGELSNPQALANGAAGDYDGYFTTLAQNAQADRLGTVIWRPGWEYDQGSSPRPPTPELRRLLPQHRHGHAGR